VGLHGAACGRGAPALPAPPVTSPLLGGIQLCASLSGCGLHSGAAGVIEEKGRLARLARAASCCIAARVVTKGQWESRTSAAQLREPAMKRKKRAKEMTGGDKGKMVYLPFSLI
jgi:hypothetical protein